MKILTKIGAFVLVTLGFVFFLGGCVGSGGGGGWE